MSTIEIVNVECPVCGSLQYLSFDENYDDEWITLLCSCLHCWSKFQINYRAASIDIIGPDREEMELKRYFKNIILDLLSRDKNLREKFDALINSECAETKLNSIVNYLLNQYPTDFADNLLPAGKEKLQYLADVIQVLCACEA